jgi:hypothetical protein
VNIPDKFFKVGIFLANYGFVTVLKQLSVTLVPEVKTDGIARKEPSHQRSKGSKSCSKQKVCMILDEYPCVTGCFSLGQEFCQALKEILSIPIVYKYLSTLYPPNHDMVQNTGSV